MMNAPLEGNDLSCYILTNYIEDGSSFPPSIWAAPPPTSNLRTTNGAERYHLDYNKQFYSQHPNIHMVISALQDIWEEYVKVNLGKLILILVFDFFLLN